MYSVNDMQTPSPQKWLNEFLMQKDAKFAETYEKNKFPIFVFLVFDKWSIVYPNFIENWDWRYL